MKTNLTPQRQVTAPRRVCDARPDPDPARAFAAGLGRWLHAAGMAVWVLLGMLVVPGAAVAQDVAAPVLQSLSFTPTSIDTTTGSATATVSARVTDDLSGVAGVSVWFYSPSGTQSRGVGLSRVSGDKLDGNYQGTATFPQYGEGGEWKLTQAYSADAVGNYRYRYEADLIALGFPTKLNVTSTPDNAVPVVQSLSFTPTSIDTTTGSATVTVSARVTDDVSGVAGVSVWFYSPSGAQSRGVGLSRVSGDKLDGNYQGTATFPQYGEGGEWKLSQAYAGDAVGNYRYRYESDLTALGFPTKLNVTSTPDVTAPVLQSLSFTPTSIDTTTGSATVTVSARVTDDLSGVAGVSVWFYSPSGTQSRGVGLSRVSGDKLDGNYQGTATFPQYGEGGEWKLTQAYSADAVGNYRYRYEADLIALGFPTKLNVTGNQPPSLTSPGNQSVNELATLTFALLATDPNPLDTLTYSIASGAQAGMSLVASSGAFSWTPTEEHGPGSYPVTFRVTDPGGMTSNQTITITVNEVNSAPTAWASNVVTEEDTAVGITLAATDPDFPANPLTYTVLTEPSHGTLSDTAPNVTYTPAGNYHGADSFTFRATDPYGVSHTATVTITVTPVNDAPVAVDNAYSLGEDMILSLGNPASGVLNNDTDADGDALTAIMVSSPSHGTVRLQPDGRFTYTPMANFNGPDTFTYKVNDGTVDSGIATVTITVNPANDLPVISSQHLSTSEDLPLAVVLSATDVDGDAVTLSVISPPAHGTVFGTPPELTYTPHANYHGSDQFGFRADDGHGGIVTATVFITVTPVNDLPVAMDDAYPLGEDMILSPITPAVGVLANDADPDGDTLTATLVTGPAHGTLTLQPDGRFTYTPTANFNGPDTFTYKVHDGTADSGIATVTITVNPANDLPVISSQHLSTSEDAPLAVVLSASDVDGDTVILSAISAPTHGAVSGTPPELTYTPAANFHGSDLFGFLADDGHGGQVSATIYITVTSVNDAPVAVDDAYPLGEDMILSPITPSIGVLKNDTDADGDTLAASLVSNPSHGTVTLQPDGRFTYTPTANFNGPDTFTYKANDGQTDSGVATVTITVNPANDAPVAVAQSVATAEDTVAAITLTGSDVDGDTLAYAITSNPSRGTLSGTAPNLSYRPWPHYHGPDQFTFQVSDGTLTASATVTIAVTPVNDVPRGNSVALTTAEDTALPVALFGADIEGGDYRVLQVFGDVTGAGRSASGGLIEGADGLLYGTTEFGGAGDNGTVFRMNRDGSGYTVLHSFAANRSQGTWPRARLVAGPGGVLYGTTTTGGNSNAGTVWKLNADGSGFTVLLHKNGFPGSSTGLLLGSDGALYGTTVFGGASNNGTVFKVGTDGSGYALLHSFSGLANEGGRPYAQLVEDADGALYGTSEVGGADAVNGGTVFKLQKNGTGFTVLQAFTGGTGNAGTLRRGLLLASDGALYGVTPTGGQNAKGTVFKVQRNGTGFQLLHQFAANGAQGGVPQAALVEDGDGVLYGGTIFNGALGGGTIFRLNKDGTGFGVLHHFGAGAADGNQMQGELVVAANDGRLYGATVAGAAPGSGVLFSLATAPTGWNYTLISHPTHGTLTGTPPALTYTPVANYNGPESFTFKANDGTVDSAPATVSITVTPVNDRPYAKQLTIQVAEDNSVAVVLSATDVLNNPFGATDADGDPLTFTVLTFPSHGTFSGTPPNLIYTPEPNFHGTEYLSYYVSDGIVTSSPAGITLVVTPVNDAPVDRDRSLGVYEDSGGGQVQPQVDADGEAVTYFVVTPPQHGRVEIQGGNLIYLPTANYNGPDSYTFKATDGTLESPLYTYTLNVIPVNDLPSADGQSLTTYDNAPLAITLAGADIETSPLTYRITSGPTVGRLSGAPPNMVYTPPSPFAGNDSFTFEVEDADGATVHATVAITILGSDRPPVAVLGADLTLVAGMNCEAQYFLDSSASHDPDGDELSFRWIVYGGRGSMRFPVPPGAPPGYVPEYYPLWPGSYTVELTVSTTKNGVTLSSTDTQLVTVLADAPGLTIVTPAAAYANGPAFNLTVTGGCFQYGATVHWNGTPRATTVVSESELSAAILASDLQIGGDIAVASIQVINGDGQVSNPLGFSIVAQTVGQVDSAIAPPGGTASVSTPPESATTAGVAVAFQNTGGEPASVLAATYDQKPVGETAFRVGAGDFVDVQIVGADQNDVAAVYFYYASTVTGNQENKLKLRYFDGSAWVAVRGSGGALPVKDTTDNLNGTLSGGQFTVVFDNTSTPKITELNGTVFGMFDATPQILAVSGPTGPLALGAVAVVGVEFATASDATPPVVRFDWDDGTSELSQPADDGLSATASHSFGEAGVYTVTVTVTDAEGTETTSKFEYVVVYDPTAGYVTGLGWLQSPAGAYAPDPEMNGTALFGFVSRYKRGLSVPLGVTEFYVHAARFNFLSTTYEWLVVAGPKAQYRGTGKINGQGNYGFILTATDGQLPLGGGQDRLRLKIWDKTTGQVVYDNRRGASDDMDAGDPQAISGGSIVIHRGR